MDAYQQHPGYIGPPQPPQSAAADPYHYHHHLLHHQQQPRPPAPPQVTWFSNQFRYQPPSSSSHSPSPPPPQQWTAPTHPDHLAPPFPSGYPPPPPPHSYATHHQFPPAHPHAPPTGPNYQIPQPNPPADQEWRDLNLGQHQVAAHKNGEDWAARARAWAAVKKVAMDDQDSQSQFISGSRSEGDIQFQDQYSQAADFHYKDIQQQFSASGYQQIPVSVGHTNLSQSAYPQEAASFNPGQSSFVPDGLMSYNAGSGTSAGATTTSPSVHLLEVPSSYSSVTGKEETADLKEDVYKSLPFPISSTQGGQYTCQTALPAVGRSVLTEQTVAYSHQTADTAATLGSQPVDFGPSFNHDHDPHVQPSYSAHDSAGTVKEIGPVATVASLDSWTAGVATGAIYPPIPPVLPSVAQPDSSIGVPSISGYAAPPFGSFSGSSFHPKIPSAGAPYVLGTGATLHPIAFQDDAYGNFNASERQKKASVPNWLKEEIIKNASVITRSSLEHPKEETEFIEDGDVDKSFGKGDQVDGKSIDSSRLTEEEDDDEDFMEAAQTAAINQEIKRILTEVLLKVTDELFDEIAMKVFDEDDSKARVDLDTFPSNYKVSPFPPAVPTPKAAAMTMVPIKAKELDPKEVNKKSTSSASGNVLGLANYGSDEDDNEIQSSRMPDSRHVQSSSPKGMHDAAENESLPGEPEEQSRGYKNLEIELIQTSSINSNHKVNSSVNELSEHTYPSKGVSAINNAEIVAAGGKTLDSGNGAQSKALLGDNVMKEFEQLSKTVIMKKSITDDYQARNSSTKCDHDNQHENRSCSGKDSVKEAEHRTRGDGRGDDIHRILDEKNGRNEKENWNGSKERSKERGDKDGEKTKESESRKRCSHLDVKETKKEADKLLRTSAKEDTHGKRERSKDKRVDRARYKTTGDSSTHKKRHSPSTGSGARDTRDKDSSDGVSDSNRKLIPSKQELSPSPVRSRRRQVLQSPHSKHSQHRQLPYSPLETKRGKSSRSRSPVRQRR